MSSPLTLHFFSTFLWKPAKPQDFENEKASFLKRVEELFEDIANKYAELET